MSTLQVDKVEFDRVIKSLKAVPDGFKPNGEYTQTKFLVGDKEVGRVSRSRREEVYELVGDAINVTKR